ncbi:MAG: glycoside hydrolase family 16 protein [Candidatus Marinimicrobia bacterium]|nr:glycoside hydrolase family 16 protein [Candidatus Neomarinimicrobiota bacterium]
MIHFNHNAVLSLLILSSILLVASCEEAEEVKDDPPLSDDPIGWTLTWEDDFDGDSIDMGSWIIADGHWSHNGEEQYYAPDEVYLHEGSLRIRSRYRFYEGKSYTSGHIESIHYQRYGRIDINAKLPGTKGMWPALWLLPAARTWPPEIDIIELLGHDPNTIYMSNHWGPLTDGKSPWELGQTRTMGFTGPDFTEAYHVFSLEWYPDSLRWLVDGEVKFISTQGVPYEPMYLIMNTAVGGGWPGSPDGTTSFPQYHDIDYVRFYEQNEDN